MADVITVASRIHTAVRMDHGDGVYTVLNGNTHPDALGGVGLTAGVDADLFNAWLDTPAGAEWQAQGFLYELNETEPAGMAHEPEPVEPVVLPVVHDKPEHQPE